jgi:Na+/H+ antiporter NhaC
MWGGAMITAGGFSLAFAAAIGLQVVTAAASTRFAKRSYSRSDLNKRRLPNTIRVDQTTL